MSLSQIAHGSDASSQVHAKIHAKACNSGTSEFVATGCCAENDSEKAGEGAHLRPMRRLTSYTVRSGLVVAWFFAASPMRRSVSVNAT